MSGRCSVCQAPLDDPLVWKDATGESFCVLHSASKNAFFSVLGGGSRQIAQLDAGILADLAHFSEETIAARNEGNGLRETLNKAAALVPPSPSASGVLGLAPGDKTEMVVGRGSDGSRVEQQLVGVSGVMKLCERGKETGPFLWTAPKEKLVVALGTVNAVGGAPFHLRLEGEVSEVQVWCRSVESMDAWLSWIRLNQPQCRVQRLPAVDQPQAAHQPPSSSLVRPSPSKMALSSHASSTPTRDPSPASSRFGNSTQTLRQRLQKTKSRQSMESDSGTDETGSGNTSGNTSGNVSATDSPNFTPRRQSSAEQNTSSSSLKPLATSGENDATSGTEKKAHRSVFGWAKKLYDKAGDLRGKDVKEGVKSMDVFVSSLEEIMEDQSVLFPNLKVPILMSTLAEEVVRRGGHCTEGIFRISASHSDVAEAIAGIKKAKNYDYKLLGKDPHIPAAIMKQWLRELPIPLFQDYFKCMEIAAMSSETPEYAESLKGVVNSLSQVHRDCAMFLISFLSFLAGDAQRVSATKMSLSNLALVFVPSFLRCPTNDVSMMLTNQPSEQRFVQTLVEYGAEGKFGPLTPQFIPPTETKE